MQKLPLGAVVTAWLGLLFVAALIWILANYSGDPAQPFAFDNCKAAVHGSSDDGRLAEYTCELAVDTAQLAGFTKLLVLVTVGLAAVGVWQGTYIRRSVQVAERNFSELERAYVFPSARDVFGFGNDHPRNLRFRVRMRSLGRTPAIIKEVAIKFTGTTPLVGTPNKGGTDSQEFDWAINDTEYTDFFVSPYEGKQYFFGFIRYLDIFGKEHHSWLGQIFDPDLGTETCMARAGGEEYNSYD